MCGISGIFNLRGRQEVDRALLRRMTERLHHRGPDGDGFYFGPGIGLGHRRLAIIDLVSGDQPIFNEDRTVCVVYNGEIYNFEPLVAELRALGHEFRTHSDTEVIVHAWEEWGPACLDRFNGMFAFALWDEEAEVLFLARDRLGEKPLYYTCLTDGRLLFASELKSLLCCPELNRTLDPQAIEEFFALGYVPDPRSIYRGIHKLAPGHCLTLRRGALAVEPRRYWDLRYPDPIKIQPEEAAEELLTRLREAVRMRMIADVPLGAFLSGGVDSSAIVGTMAGICPDPVRSFSIGFGGEREDESLYAADVAQRYKTEHHLKQVDSNSFEVLHRLSAIYDEPFGDSSAIPTLHVCAMARENVTVALSGDGADEAFAGYRRYRWHVAEERVRRVFPPSVRNPVFGVLGQLYPKFDWLPRALRAKATLQELALDTAAAYFSSVSICSNQFRSRLFSSSFRRQLDGYCGIEVIRKYMAESGTDEPLQQIQYVDFKTYLPGDILTKVDRASMDRSLEVRPPFLDHTLVSWAAQLPPRLKLHGRCGKYILKAALEPHLPSDIIYRPKQGFVVPLAAWFRGPLRQHVSKMLIGPTLRESGLFDMDFIDLLIRQHVSGSFDHSAPIWLLLTFAAFLSQTNSRQANVVNAYAAQ